MEYVLGIDIGTSRTAAAVYVDGKATIVPLGDNSATMPSAVFVQASGSFLVGDSALRRGANDPTRLAREFKRRFGDSTPLRLGDAAFTPEQLTAVLLRHVVEFVAARMGSAPGAVVLAHPANWGSYRIDLLRSEAHAAGVSPLRLVAEPVAAAVHFASGGRVHPGEITAVYDLGGGTFDATVLRKTVDGFAQIGEAKGIERLGGVDFDEQVFLEVLDQLHLDEADLNEMDAADVARLKSDCRAAKEALSDDPEVTVRATIRGGSSEVVVTRRAIERLLRPALRSTVDSLRTTILDSGVAIDDVSSILMVGGSSRIPLAADLVRTELGRPISLTTHPKESVALGASMTWSGQESPEEPAIRTVPIAETSPQSKPRSTTQPTTQPRRSRRLAIAGAGLLVAAASVVAVIVKSGSNDTAQTDQSLVVSTRTVPVTSATPVPETTTTTAPATTTTTVPDTRPTVAAPVFLDTKDSVLFDDVGFELLPGEQFLPGDCLTVQRSSSTGFRRVDCKQAHTFELYTHVDYTGRADLVGSVSDFVDQTCTATFFGYVGTQEADSAFNYQGLYSSDDPKVDGYIDCLIMLPDEKAWENTAKGSRL